MSTSIAIDLCSAACGGSRLEVRGLQLMLLKGRVGGGDALGLRRINLRLRLCLLLLLPSFHRLDLPPLAIECTLVRTLMTERTRAAGMNRRVKRRCSRRLCGGRRRAQRRRWL